MKNLFVITYLILFSHTIANAQWSKVLGKNSVPSQSIDVFKYESNLLLRAQGGIYYSRDEGRNWRVMRPEYFNIKDDIYSLRCIMNQYGIFSIMIKRPENSYIDSTFLVFTADFGKTWEIKNLNISSVFDSHFLSSFDYPCQLFQSKDYVHVIIDGTQSTDYSPTICKIKKNTREITYLAKKYDRHVRSGNYYVTDAAEFITYATNDVYLDINYHDGRKVTKLIPYRSNSYFIVKDSLFFYYGYGIEKAEFSKDFGKTWYNAGSSFPIPSPRSSSLTTDNYFHFSFKDKLYIIVNAKIYSSSDDGLNWFLESDEIQKYTGVFNPKFSIQDSILTFSSCYSGWAPGCDKKYIYNILTKKITYLNTEIIQNSKFLNLKDKIIKLPNGKLLKATEQNPHVNYLSDNDGRTWKISTDYPYYFDKIQINDSTFYVFDYYNNFDSDDKPVVKFINNLRRDTLSKSSFLAFSNWLQKGDTIVAYPKGYNDTIVYSINKPYDKWFKVPTNSLSNSLIFFENGKIFSYYPWGDTKLDLFDLKGGIQKTSASEYNSMLLNISEPNNLWFGSLSSVYNTKDLGVTKRRIFIPIPDRYSSSDIPDAGMLAVIKKNDVPLEKVLVVVARNTPYISIDSGKTWVSFNLGLEKDITYKVQQVDSFLFAITDKGMYRRSINDVSLRSISGTVFIDINANNKQDENEKGVLNAKVYLNLNGAFTYTDSLGKYNLIADIIGTDTLKASFDNKYATIAPQFHIATKSDTGKNFAIKLAPNVNDIKVNLTAITPARSGFNNEYLLSYKNVGSTKLNGNVLVSYNPNQSFVTATNTPTSNINQVIAWNYENFEPNESRTIKFTLKTAVNAPIRSNLMNIANITPVNIDTFKSDNIDTLVQTVVGSYDPNDKQISFLNSRAIPSVIDPSTELIYTIRFQNTGNYPADFVKVVDTLSDKLDVSSFRLIATSHQGSVSIRNKNVLTFDFNPIYLPDSTRDEAKSHGFVKFAIKPKRALSNSEAIKNTGFIYFDYNPAIVTNTVETANIKTSLFAPSVSAEKLDISPNPAQQSILIKIENPNFESGNMSIYDLSGRLILSKTVFNRNEVVDINQLKSGEYICIIKSNDNKMFMNKFVKVQ